MPSKSLYWHTFGSLTTALREAGFDVAVGEERLDRALDQGVLLAIQLGRLPKFADWAEARRPDINMLTEWQVYRMFDARRGAWSTFQFLLRERLVKQGVEIKGDGTPPRLGRHGVASTRTSVAIPSRRTSPPGSSTRTPGCVTAASEDAARRQRDRAGQRRHPAPPRGGRPCRRAPAARRA